MDLITVEEVASKLRVKKSWVYAHSGGLGAYRVGKYLRFLWPRVMENLEQEQFRSDDANIRKDSACRLKETE